MQDLTNIESPLSLILSNISFSHLISTLIIIAGAVVLAKLIQNTKPKLLQKFPKHKLKIEQLLTVFIFLILLLGIVTSILAFFGFSKEVMLTLAGSSAVALGFAMKDLAASTLAGFIILFERPYQVGDRIIWGDHYGDVIAIGLRSTQIRTLDDSIVSLPNNLLFSHSVSSANAGALDMLVQTDIYAAIDTPLQNLEDKVKEAVLCSPYLMLNKNIDVLLSNNFQNNILCTQIRIKAYVIETQFEKAFQSDLYKRVKRLFKQENIAYPSLKLENNAK